MDRRIGGGFAFQSGLSLAGIASRSVVGRLAIRTAPTVPRKKNPRPAIRLTATPNQSAPAYHQWSKTLLASQVASRWTSHLAVPPLHLLKYSLRGQPLPLAPLSELGGKLRGKGLAG